MAQIRIFPHRTFRPGQRHSRRDGAETEEMGITVEAQHHEVAPAQHEIDIKFDTLLKTADNLQWFKYVIRNVAREMVKPRHSCRSQCSMTTETECTPTSHCGKTVSLFLPEISMQV